MTNKVVHFCHFEQLMDRVLSRLDYSEQMVMQYKSYFKDQFIDKVIKDKNNYYMFIVAERQMPKFQAHMDKYHMNECVVATRKGVKNQNYRGIDHPELTWFIFNFPETYKSER